MKAASYILIGFVFGTIATFCTIASFTNRAPPTPIIREAESITIFLHPWHQYEAATCEPVSIPVESQEDILRRLAPEKYYGKVYETISPLVADVFITHADRSQTHVLVREGGHNPAMVSVDGVNYFYAKNESDVYAGAHEIIGLVAEIAHKQQTQQKPE